MLKIYNTLTNNLDVFKPINEGSVTMYVCGPTVYNYIHIGNARPLVFFDVVYRYFKAAGYDATYISNFTDIDDKIINKAIEEVTSEEVIASRYIAAYNEDLKNLNCMNVDIRCKVTDYMEQIITFIDRLVQDGFAYKSGSDVYFRVSKLEKYGLLSNNVLDELNAGNRVDINTNKEHPADFTLWKETDKGITFPSTNGEGRPGWHTECVVMIKSLTDGMIDIHGGGQDLCFPHHENEIAQSMAYDNTTLANYWMHNAFLNLDNTKMSKSLGNVVLTRDFIEMYGGNVLRLSLLQTHYRSVINFTDEFIDSSLKLNEKIFTTFKTVSLKVQLKDYFLHETSNIALSFLEDDFNTANLITYLIEVIKHLNAELRIETNELKYYHEFMQVLDLLGLKYEYPVLNNEDIIIYNTWNELRLEKNFEEADKVRYELETRGVL